ncbi:hypothetical protein WG907_05075 [Sphingobium sp. AN558]|uniref:hypothetical protein n=1 Tax=Sphingobium sp. AN558 TaxID=3133442 RepID=UPI0030BDEFB1
MTKIRAPLSFALAVHEITTLIGVTTARRVTGRAKRTLQLWREGGQEATPSLAQAFALDRAYVEAGGEGLPPIIASYLRQIEAFMAATEACRLALIEDIANVARESADAVAASMALTQPGVRPTAIHHAIAEAEQNDAAIGRLLARLKSFLPGNGVGQGQPGDRK